MAKVEKRDGNPWYTVDGLPDGGYWTFDAEEDNLLSIDSAIEAWTAWREFVASGGLDDD